MSKEKSKIQDIIYYYHTYGKSFVEFNYKICDVKWSFQEHLLSNNKIGRPKRKEVCTLGHIASRQRKGCISQENSWSPPVWKRNKGRRSAASERAAAHCGHHRPSSHLLVQGMHHMVSPECLSFCGGCCRPWCWEFNKLCFASPWGGGNVYLWPGCISINAHNRYFWMHIYLRMALHNRYFIIFIDLKIEHFSYLFHIYNFIYYSSLSI